MNVVFDAANALVEDARQDEGLRGFKSMDVLTDLLAQATVHLVSSTKDKLSVFKVKNIVVKVDTFKFSDRDSKHDFLCKTLKRRRSRTVSQVSMSMGSSPVCKTGMM